MDKEEQKKKSEEIRKVLKVKNEYNLTEEILKEVSKRHRQHKYADKTKEDR